MNYTNITIVFLLLLIPFIGWSQTDIFGHWKTIDDETGKEKSVVEIFDKNGKAYGKIISLLNPDEPNPICDKCSDDRKDEAIEGMEIIRGMEKDDDEWSEGTIIDPENGKSYDCKIWVEDGKLQVRGYIAFFFRTQEWIRVN
ncbi:MAG: hypothetical protein ACI8XB_000079 [Patiriisocius sp.]|jgi:uncharacterized protein (DUF2147 family)